MKEIANYYNSSRLEVTEFVPQNIKTILDIGCGQGSFLKVIKEQTGAEIWGVEALPEVGKKAKEFLDKILIGKVEEVISLIPDSYFDCITFNDVLEHLLEPTEVLKLIKPKLSPKGIIIASIPNVRYFANLRELLIYKDWEYKDSGILDSTHFRFFTEKSMRRMFMNANLNLINQVGISQNRSWKFRLFNIVTFGFFSDTRYLRFICIAN